MAKAFKFVEGHGVVPVHVDPRSREVNEDAWSSSHERRRLLVVAMRKGWKRAAERRARELMGVAS